MSELAIEATRSVVYSTSGNFDLNYCPISNSGDFSSLGYKCWRKG